jgi:hypothetical protein
MDCKENIEVRRLRIDFAQRWLDYRIETYYKLIDWFNELGYDEFDISSRLLTTLKMTRDDLTRAEDG